MVAIQGKTSSSSQASSVREVQFNNGELKPFASIDDSSFTPFAACTQPVCDIGKWLWARIGTSINYARKLSKNREVLRKKAHDLSLKRKDIVAEIERNPQKIATNECDDWIGKVQEMANKVNTIQSELNEEKRCVGGLCLDIFARIELGKRVVNLIDGTNELLDESKFERGYLVDAPVATVENQPDPPSTLAESANRTLNMVLGKIQHKSTLKIGIWGMGGRMIQEEVGQRLSVEITKGESDDRVATKLRQRLHGKKYLLLLDDVWNMVDLDAVGIPNPNQNNGCKVVLTTRKLEVCRQMETDIDIYQSEEDSEIKKSELIGYWRAEGILSREITLHEAHVKGHAILRALIDSSLLEKCDEDDCVKMHDVVRDLVLAMTSPKHLVRAGISSEKIPDAVEWEKATRISFINHDLRNLPESPDCPELLTLLLQGNGLLGVIPETFFNNMPKLKVLDLSRTGIESLPTSISKLESLRELVLSDCRFLKALPGVICKLSQIEVFKLQSSYRGTSALSDESTGIVAKELSELSSLSSLGFDFRRVGGEERDSGLPSAIQDVLRRSNCFGLRGHEKLSTLLDVGAHNTYELKSCVIRGCDVLQKIIDRNGLEMGAFPKLEVLLLADLPELKTILCLEMEEGALLPPLPPNANIFTNLKCLTLWKCPLIKQVFSSGFMVQQLSNLEALHVDNCGGLKGMIPEDEIVEHEALPKLSILCLLDLSEFDSFFKGVPMRWQSLEEVGIINCPKLRKLPFDTNSAPDLKEIGVGGNYQEWWDALEWDNDATRLQFQPFLTQY
ncbi:hypothetical protein RHGRI_037472 [Rhododendron griersonianum]|uniref:NB-ARC domain-containing protein n=1 Tax=Rhododendron griersonianum TaxID=479676 RepID=A0AAV6HSM1_9ERIC|nr:hypothetical protein RHGRI_037472 [Rhododendron griersonianum]